MKSIQQEQPTAIPSKEEFGRQTILRLFVEIMNGKENLSVMGLQGIPIELIEEQKKFADFFKEEFFELNKEGLERFTKFTRLALESFWGAFNGDHNRFQCSKLVKQRIEKGFNSVQDVWSFFQLVGISNQSDLADFFQIKSVRNSQLSQKEQKQLSACKVLKRSLALYALEKPLEDLKEWIHFTFGREGHPPKNGNTKNKSGVLSELSHFPEQFIKAVKDRPNTLENFIKEDGMLEIISKEDDGVQLMLNEELVQHIERIEFSLKNPRIALEKIERKGYITAEDINDLFRMRIIVKDQENPEKTEAVLFEIETALCEKCNLNQIHLEVRNKKLLSTKTQSDLEELNPNRDLIWIDGHANSESGAGYKSLNNKFRYKDENGNTNFAFEIQVLPEKQHIKNEDPKTSAHHLPVELRRFISHVGQLEGFMTEDNWKEVINIGLKAYEENRVKMMNQILDIYKPKKPGAKSGEFVREYKPSTSTVMKEELLNTFSRELGTYEKKPEVVFPAKITGDPKIPLNKADELGIKTEFRAKTIDGGKAFEINLRKSKDKAQAILDYLVLSGSLTPVAPNYLTDFSNTTRASKHLTNTSRYFAATGSYEKQEQFFNEIEIETDLLKLKEKGEKNKIFKYIRSKNLLNEEDLEAMKRDSSGTTHFLINLLTNHPTVYGKVKSNILPNAA